MEKNPIIDAHMHLWNLSENHYPWLQEAAREMWIGDYSSLQRNYLIEDYLGDVRAQNVVRCVHLQAQWDHGDPIGETRWLQSIADQHGYPQGIVAFCDFRRPDARDIIEGHLEFANVRGIRMDINWHEDPFYRFCEDRDIMKNEAWLTGFSLLQDYELSFDLQIYAAYQGEDAYQLVKRFDRIQFILDHSGAPADRSPEGIDRWQRALERLAELPNIATKLSGFDMFDHHWTQASLSDMILRVVDRFGPERCLFASNFPVSSLYGSYDRLVDAHRQIFADFSETEQRQIFHDNAARYYRV